MINPADYLFYRVLQWRLTQKHVDRMPLLTTQMAMAVILYFHLLTILPWIPIAKSLVHPSPALGLIAILAVLGVVHLMWITSGRYRTLDAKFADESPSQRMRRTWMIYAYLTVTLFALMLSLILMRRFSGSLTGVLK